MGPIGPNVVSRLQAQRSRNFFRDSMGLLVCLINPLPKALGLNCPNLDCPFEALDHKHQSLEI